MAWINCGALVNGGLQRPLTKKELRDKLRDDPPSVSFDVTSPLGEHGGELLSADDIGTDKLSVCGPDPYTSRRWYATVSRKGDKIVVT